MKKGKYNTINKIMPLLLLACISIYTQKAFSQGQNGLEASVAGMLKFNDFPVSNYTGIPNISVPLMKIPTRSKDLAIDLSLTYHPGSVAISAGRPTDFGRGWSMFTGGVIAVITNGVADEVWQGNDIDYKDTYQFSFMGHAGRFFFKKNEGVITLKVIENDGDNLKITYDYDTLNNRFNSFTIFDDKGYKFVFDVFDTSAAYAYNALGVVNYRSAYHLSRVVDNNDKELLSLTYATRIDPYVGDSDKESIFKKVNKITVAGYGSINYNYAPEASPGVGLKTISSVTVDDNYGHRVKTYKFTRESDSRYLKSVSSIKTDSGIETVLETYGFDYNGHTYLNSKADWWGYLNSNSTSAYPIADGCFQYFQGNDPGTPDTNYESNMTHPDLVTTGVLTKMTLPTGGCIMYNYESNTYADYEFDANWFQLVDNSEHYYNNDEFDLNHTITDFDTLYPDTDPDNLDKTKTFTIPANTNQTEYFFEVHPAHYSNAGLENEFGSSDLIAQLQLTGPNGINYDLSYGDDHIYNKYNHCMGWGLILPAGTYSITMTTMGPLGHTSTIIIRERKRNPVAKRWIYGGGIRIKEIGYFEKSNIPMDYYARRDIYTSLGWPPPAREKKYSYTFFDHPDISSGAPIYYYGTIYDEGQSDRISRDQVGYKNVTVTNLPDNGREEFTYTSPFDFSDAFLAGTETLNVYYNYKRGLLTNKKTYDKNNVLLSDTSFNYEYVEGSNDLAFFYDPAFNELFGWAKLKQKTTNNYYSNAIDAKQIKETFTYNDTNRKVATHTVSNSLGLGETLKTEYSYHTGNSPFSQNRITEVEQVNTYRNTELLSSSRINYSNSWGGSTNQSYLPQSSATAKGSNTLENTTKYNLYDDYGNVLETEQENGMKTCYIWGYNKSQIVAKLENMDYATLNGTGLVNAIVTASDSSLATAESSLLAALAPLRSSTTLAPAMITTYTYKPLIGISTVTDPKGDKISYEYDDLGRQKVVRDRDDKILSENQYHYSTQN